MKVRRRRIHLNFGWAVLEINRRAIFWGWTRGSQSGQDIPGFGIIWGRDPRRLESNVRLYFWNREWILRRRQDEDGAYAYVAGTGSDQGC